jgi:hypothetical protein
MVKRAVKTRFLEMKLLYGLLALGIVVLVVGVILLLT